MLLHCRCETDNSLSKLGPCSLVGRDLLTLKNLSVPEIETLLWTAKDLKIKIKDNKQVSFQIQYSSCYMTTPSARSKWWHKRDGRLSEGCELLVHVHVLYSDCYYGGWSASISSHLPFSNMPSVIKDWLSILSNTVKLEINHQESTEIGKVFIEYHSTKMGSNNQSVAPHSAHIGQCLVYCLPESVCCLCKLVNQQPHCNIIASDGVPFWQTAEAVWKSCQYQNSHLSVA